MTRARWARAVFSTSFLLAAIACGSSATSEFENGGGSSGTSGEPEGNGTGTFKPGDQTDGATGDAYIDLNACAIDKQQGKLAPLDLVLMQDTSGSMWGYTTGTTTKWTAIKGALGAFMADPGSAGLGLGVEFFPKFENNVPNSCTTTAECGATGGSCITMACSKTGNLCTTQADCIGGANTCTQLQRCVANQEAICLASGDCLAAGLSPTTCNQPLVRGVCQTPSISCTVTDYSTLAAPVAALPGAAVAVNGALNARIPYGRTPTHAALQGAIAAAKAHAATRPDAVVAVLLSTDGIPFTAGKCTDDVNAIAAVAAAALAGTPSIKTFVIGVLSPQDVANGTPTLNAIAAAGGTTSASIVGASANTQAEFIAALQKVRGESLPCQFDLPIPEAGTPDYAKVNVVYTDPTTKAQTLINYVTSAASCDPAKGGWHYDVAPPSGKPSKVILCPASCSTVQKSLGGVVDVVQGCATQTTTVPK